MIEELLYLVAPFLDIGNIIFFVAGLPQMIAAYRNRKNIKGLSLTMLLGFFIASILFILVGIITGGIFVVVLGCLNEIMFASQIYWLRKYRKKPMEKVVKRKKSFWGRIICLFKGHKWGCYVFNYKQFCLRCGTQRDV